MTMNRVRVAWTGFPGAPGVSTFYFGSSTTDMGALRTFFNAFAALVPANVSMQIASTGDQINETDGHITGTWVGPAQASVAGGGGVGAYSSASGGMVKWVTPQVVNGRRPIGKTFFVPAVTTAFDATGTLLNSLVTTLQAAASALVVAYAGEMKIFHRPGPGGIGVSCTIIAGIVQDKQFVLRSRRD